MLLFEYWTFWVFADNMFSHCNIYVSKLPWGSFENWLLLSSAFPIAFFQHLGFGDVRFFLLSFFFCFGNSMGLPEPLCTLSCLTLSHWLTLPTQNSIFQFLPLQISCEVRWGRNSWFLPLGEVNENVNGKHSRLCLSKDSLGTWC